MVPPLPAYEGGSLRCFHFKARKCLIPSASPTTEGPFHLFLQKPQSDTTPFFRQSAAPFLSRFIHRAAAASFSLIHAHTYLSHVHNGITCCCAGRVMDVFKRGGGGVCADNQLLDKTLALHVSENHACVTVVHNLFILEHLRLSHVQIFSG